MRTEVFDYQLPAERIAQRPSQERDGGRLLVLDRGDIAHRWIRDWPELVPEGALVVLNDSKVLKARLLCRRRDSGGKAELLLLEPRSPAGESEVWLAVGHANRPLRAGALLELEGAQLRVLERAEQGLLQVEIRHPGGVAALLDRHGQVPLPPYIERAADQHDVERYQTVFAAHIGSVAAPTAGLHLSASLLERLQQRGIELAAVTLHVGLGTFRPVSVEDLDRHPMHSETFEVSPELAQCVNAARGAGRALVAVGTTVVRALESAVQEGRLAATRGATRLLIQPGYRFQLVDALLTNFHAPRSTLLALVSAFAGIEPVRAAYQAAVAGEYRFLSYGDAMWLPTRAQEIS